MIDAASQGVNIELRPDIWFRNANGTVLNLALWTFSTLNDLVEFEAEFEGGVEIEID